MKRLYIALTMLLVSATTLSAETKVNYLADIFPDEYCLALNIYYESRGSSLADQIAVADVVINRVNDTRYPDTVCAVVKQGRVDNQGNMIRHKCQFSWYCDGKPDTPQDMDSWVNAQTIAWKMMQSKSHIGITEGATHYHAHYVNPKWAKELTVVGTIGNHKFYRWDRK